MIEQNFGRIVNVVRPLARFHLSFTSVLLVCLCLKSSGAGQITDDASLTYKVMRGKNLAYRMSKCALNMLTRCALVLGFCLIDCVLMEADCICRSLSDDVKQYNILVNSVCP